MTIAEFLKARIAEDKVDALRCRNLGAGLDDLSGWVEVGSAEVDAAEALFARFSPARVLAECEAKLQIVAEYERDAGYGPDYGHALYVALMCLVGPYADHPDCAPEWRHAQ